MTKEKFQRKHMTQEERAKFLEELHKKNEGPVTDLTKRTFELALKGELPGFAIVTKKIKPQKEHFYNQVGMLFLYFVLLKFPI